MLPFLLIMASLTSYLDGDATTVYVLRTNESLFEMPLQEGNIAYALSDKGEIEYELTNGTLTLYGNNQSFFIIKIVRPLAENGRVREFTLYNPGLDITEHKLYLPENSTLINIYPKPDADGNPIRWSANSNIYAVKYQTMQKDEDIMVPLVGIALIILFLLVYSIYKLMLKKRIEEKAFEEKIKGFNEYEKNILRVLNDNKEIRQRDIALMLNLKKSHVSKLLGKMEARFLIRRKRFGKIVKVQFGEFFEKK